MRQSWITKPLFDRWAEKVIIHDSGCWLWVGALRIRSPWGDFKPPHLSYEFFIGVVPNEVSTIRTCDTTNCVNPHHLILSNNPVAIKQSRIDRFWRNTRPGSNGCIEYTGSRSVYGYGLICHMYNVSQAHRFSWLIANGPIPEGLWVLHKCDNPPCVNPDHLFLGTPLDNVNDMLKKGRGKHYRLPPISRPGEKHPFAKLTDAKVRLIRADTRPDAEIAADYGVSRTVIWEVQARRTWRHI